MSAPISAPSISIDVASPYEGQSVTWTFTRPTTYNAGTNIDYYVVLTNDLANPLTSVLSASTNATVTKTYTMANKTTGLSDFSTYFGAYCIDSEYWPSDLSATTAITIKRFRYPTITISDISRAETSAVVSVTVSDTGYASPQASSQVNKVQYNIGAGWVDATLGSWTGLDNSFTISGLTASTQYSLSVKVVNNAPTGTGLSNRTSLVATTDTILSYVPPFWVFNDSAIGIAGSFTKALGIDPEDFSKKHFLVDLSGWIRDYNTWTYASATTFTIAGDHTSRFSKDDKIYLTQTTAKYFEVYSVSYSAPNTTVTIAANGTYTLTSATITETFYSKVANPQGWPDALKARFKIGTLTRNQTSSTGNVAYTGVGFRPKIVKFLASNGASGIVGTSGVDDGTTHFAMNVLSGSTAVLTDRSINASDAATWAQYGYIASMDSDGFTIAWTKFGSPPAGTITVGYEAIR